MIENKIELELLPKAPPVAPPAPMPPAPRAPVLKPAVAAPSEQAGPMATGLLAKLHEQRLEFTGTGSEYFRIWVVNALLTLATLGVYSAWAKRRKASWFARHTLLAGDGFDFHGDPRRIGQHRRESAVRRGANRAGGCDFDSTPRCRLSRLRERPRRRRG